MLEALSASLILKIVNQYIGVSGGYLGNLSYRTHQDFYPEYCDLEIDPNQFEGTTRERFIKILSGCSRRDQAKILRGVLSKFPLDETGKPQSRTASLHDEILMVADELDRNSLPLSFPSRITVAVVGRAIADAEALLKANGATSAVDRIHTALHGFLIQVCRDAFLVVQGDPTLPALFKMLREQHPAFQVANEVRAEDITQILRAAGSILDVINPIRNRASMAHPNLRLLANEEAMLVINIARSILHYLESKLTESSTGACREGDPTGSPPSEGLA